MIIISFIISILLYVFIGIYIAFKVIKINHAILRMGYDNIDKLPVICFGFFVIFLWPLAFLAVVIVSLTEFLIKRYGEEGVLWKKTKIGSSVKER